MSKETITTEKKAADRHDINDFESRSEWLPKLAENDFAFQKASPAGVAKDGYYGLPMLKRPLWKWEIALYFFFEGISSGAYLLGNLAEFGGRTEYKNLIRAARYISLATLIPCPPLLIADLGKPQKFHHMLRVWKPKSPMNLGAWALTAFSLPVGLLAVRQLSNDDALPLPKIVEKTVALVPSRVVGAAGIPFALTMLSYPGVLLSTTSTPVWSRTRLLGALFAAASLHNAVSALSLANSLGGDKTFISNKLEKLENLTTVAEAAALTAYIATSKSAAEPLTKGRYAKLFWLGAVGAGIVAPALIRFGSSEKRKKSPAKKILGSVLSLAGGLALKWAVTHAGRASAEDPKAAREATRPNKDNPGWKL